MNGRGSWTYPVHADCLLDMLRSAAMLKEHIDEPYSFEAACVSYMLDTDRGAAKGEADYTRIWGWTRKQLRTRWEDILATVANWSSAYGRLAAESKGQTGANEGPSEGQPRASQGPTEGQHTISTPNAINSQQEESFPPPASVEEVVTHGSMIGVPADLCRAFFEHYDALLWCYYPERGNPIPPGRWKWQAKLRGWWLKERKNPSMPTNGKRGTRTPTTDEYGLMSRDDIAAMTTRENGLMASCEWYKLTSTGALYGRKRGTGAPIPSTHAIPVTP
jgi:hypothetical protein